MVEEAEEEEEEPEVRQARRTAIIATIKVQGWMTHEELARATDWQIEKLYWHKRNKDQEIEIPGWEPVMRAKRAGTMDDDMKAVAMLESVLGGLLKPGSAAEAKEKLKAKYAPPPAPPEDGKGV